MTQEKEKKDDGKELVSVRPGDLQKLDPLKEIEFATTCAKSLKNLIDQKKNKVMIQGKEYITYEDWQTIARFYNLTVGSEETERIEDNGKFRGYNAKAFVYNQQGIKISSAEALCCVDEKNWSGKPEFQLKSMAQTRASAKALRNVLAWVVVLAGLSPTPAEEMDGVKGYSSQGGGVSTYKPGDNKKCYCQRCKKSGKNTEITKQEAEFSKQKYNLYLCRDCQDAAKKHHDGDNRKDEPAQEGELMCKPHQIARIQELAKQKIKNDTDEYIIAFLGTYGLVIQDFRKMTYKQAQQAIDIFNGYEAK